MTVDLKNRGGVLPSSIETKGTPPGAGGNSKDAVP